MKKIKFYYVKYKNIKITLGHSSYNFEYYAQDFKNHIVLILNTNLDSKTKSKILHSTIRKCDKKV